MALQVKMEGFDLLSKESVALQNKQSSTSMEGDAWIISLHEAENLLLVGGARKKVLSILKTIRDRHLDLQGNPVSMFVLQTLVLYECEKHPREEDWEEVRYIFMVMCLVVRVPVVVVKLFVTIMIMIILRHTSETELVGS